MTKPIYKPPKWAVGVTAVSARESLLNETLNSLQKAGFDNYRLFIDGDWRLNHYDRNRVTFRIPRLGSYGNWMLALGELLLRNHDADRFAIFQDDVLAYRNLRAYLDTCKIPDKAYWNLCTYPINHKLAPSNDGWYLSGQNGKGAQGLVFSRDSAVAILNSPVVKEHALNAHQRVRDRNIDGMVNTALKRGGYKEYVHKPSLIDHYGARLRIPSTMRSNPQPIIDSFRGEEFDAMLLLPAAVTTVG